MQLLLKQLYENSDSGILLGIMEPIKNTNNINASNNEPLEPVFRGMPKPGQPLASTPRVNVTAPSPIATPPVNLPTSNSFSSQVTPSASPFSAHAPSALDRLMNPNIDKQMPPISTPPVSVPPTVVPQAGVMQSSMSQASVPHVSVSQSQPIAPASSTFKPYTAPVINVPSSMTSSAPSQNPSSSTYSSVPVSSNSFTSGYKVGAPTQYPPAQSASLSAGAFNKPMSQSPSSYSNGIPAAPSANITAAKLGNEVNSILNNQQKIPKSHKGTLVLIISMIVVLLLLAGGGYYWYTYMYLPSKGTVENETTQNSPEDFYNQANTTNTNSAFPPAATKPVVVTQPVTVPAKTAPTKTPAVKTPPKVTRVTTPFNQSQRDMVSSYISSNINKFATPKSKGAYEVTDVTFDGPDRAVVQYTNGSMSYTAVAVASIDTADNVRIVSFSLLEK